MILSHVSQKKGHTIDNHDLLPELEYELISTEPELNEILSIYKIVCEDNRIYNNIVWQFPTALIAANGILIQALRDGPAFILLIISILNYGLIFALFKLGHNQRAIINAMINSENLIRVINNKRYQELIPDFAKNRPKILEQNARKVISFMLLISNCIYFIIEFARTISEGVIW